MDRWLLCFFLGAILSLFLPIVPEVFYVILFTIISVIILLIKPIRYFAALFAAMAWIIFHGALYNNIWLNNDIDQLTVHQKPIQVIGKVKSIPTIQQQVQRFNFDVTHWHGKPLYKPIKLRLSWKDSVVQLKQGQEWQLNVKIKPAHGYANSATFSYQTWLRAKNIHATGYVKNKGNALLEVTSSYRQSLISQYRQLLPASELTSLLMALSFGERQDISQPQWQILNITGTQHLIAISGLHLGLVASFVYLFARLVFFFAGTSLKIIPRLNTKHIDKIFNHINTHYVALIISGCVAILYAYFAGFAIPTLRALTMLLVFIYLKLQGIYITKVRMILIVLALIIVFMPFSLVSASFWLSFYAVSVIFWMLWRFPLWFTSDNKILKWLKGIVFLQLGICFLMMPIVAMISNQLTLVSFLANLISVPWMSVTAIPLCLLAVICLIVTPASVEIFTDLALKSIEINWQYLSLLSELDWSLISISVENLLIVITSMMTLVALRLFSTMRVYSVIGAGVVLLIIMDEQFEKYKPWQVTVLDVGQGLAIVIERNNRAILYDTGASYSSGFSLAKSVVIPYLKGRGINKLDYLILSHQDNDHAGGIEDISGALTIGKQIDNFSSLTNKLSCQQGEYLSWRGLTVEFLWPDVKTSNFTQLTTNDSSCVIRISDEHNSVLLTGDISSKIERKIAHLTQLDVDIVIAPHHGSKTSSSNALINAVSPEIAVFSSGYLNHWRMPHHEVLARYQRRGIKTLNTAEEGMITFSFDNSGYQISRFRQQHWPFWFAN